MKILLAIAFVFLLGIVVGFGFGASRSKIKLPLATPKEPRRWTMPDAYTGIMWSKWTAWKNDHDYSARCDFWRNVTAAFPETKDVQLKMLDEYCLKIVLEEVVSEDEA